MWASRKLWLNYTRHKTPNKKLYATEETTVALIVTIYSYHRLVTVGNMFDTTQT